jgi:uncharacterized protein (DUF3820 family)
MIAHWLGSISNYNDMTYDSLQVWINHVRYVYYQEPMPFGKYKMKRLSDLPMSYIKWVLEDLSIGYPDLRLKLLELLDMSDEYLPLHFKQLKMRETLNNYITFRDTVYRNNWRSPRYDFRTTRQRRNIFKSLIERPWFRSLPEVTPEHYGEVYVEWYLIDRDKYDISECVSVERDDGIYTFSYVPMKVGNMHFGIAEEDFLKWYGCLDQRYGHTLFDADNQDRIVFPVRGQFIHPWMKTLRCRKVR